MLMYFVLIVMVMGYVPHAMEAEKAAPPVMEMVLVLIVMAQVESAKLVIALENATCAKGLEIVKSALALEGKSVIFVMDSVEI